MRIRNPEKGEAAASAATAIVLNVPAHLKHLVLSIESLIEVVDKRAVQLSRDGRAVDYAEIEREFAERVGAIETAAHRCILKAAVAVEPRIIEVSGETYTRVGEGVGTYYTMTGPRSSCAASTVESVNATARRSTS